MDNNGVKLGPGQVGEVVVKTPFLMKQYVNLPLVLQLFKHLNIDRSF